MIAPTKKPSVSIETTDGNAFGVMGAVRKALRKSGADEEYINKYIDEAKSGNYDNLLQVSMQYAEFE